MIEQNPGPKAPISTVSPGIVTSPAGEGESGADTNLRPEQLARFRPHYTYADDLVAALLRKRHPLLPTEQLTPAEFDVLLHTAAALLNQVKQGVIPADLRDYLSGFYSARAHGRIPFNFILPSGSDRRTQARVFVRRRAFLGAIFSTFPTWDGRLPPSETLQWCWLVQLWRTAQQDARFQAIADGLAVLLGLLIGLHEAFQAGYATLFAHGGAGRALLTFDLLHADAELKAYRRYQRRVGVRIRRRPSTVRQEDLDSDVGLVIAEWLGRPIEDILAEFDKLRLVPYRLKDRRKDLRRTDRAQKRGTRPVCPQCRSQDLDLTAGTCRNCGAVLPSKPPRERVPHVGLEAVGNRHASQIDVKAWRAAQDAQDRATDPAYVAKVVADVTSKLGKTAGRIVEAVMQPGQLPDSLSVSELAREAKVDPKTWRKYRPKIEAYLRKRLTP